MTATRLNPKPTTVNTTTTKAMSTSWAYTGVYFTIPQNSVYAYRVQGSYWYGRPYGICLSNSSTSMETHRQFAYSIDSSSTTMAGFTADELTVYVWAKYENATNNNIYIRGWHMPA